MEAKRMIRHIDVVGAVIVRDNTVLAAQRSPQMALPLTWEFPGGKVEPGETAVQALAREIAEELNCVIEIGDEIITADYAYDFAVVRLRTFYATLVAGEPRATEHSQLKWIALNKLRTLEWAPADMPTVCVLESEPPQLGSELGVLLS